MTRVLVIEPAGNLWGSERALLDAVDGMSATEIAMCCPPGRPIFAEFERRSIPVFPYFIYALHNKSWWARVRAAFGVIRACLAFRPDVIHLNQAGCYRVVLPAARLLNIPIVAHVRIFEDVDYLAVVRPSARNLRGIIAISAVIAAELRAYPQLSGIPVTMLYDAYVPDIATDKPNTLARFSARIGCIGRIVPIKGQDLLIEAMHSMRRDGCDDVECLMVGDGPAEYVRTLKAAAGHGPAASAIKWLGTRNDVILLLRGCTVMVCPSRREPLGRVIFEAWDAGAIPVACASSGGAAEIITAADGGILYDEQTPESLAGAVKMALRLPPDEAARLIANGRAWMAKNCDPKRYGEAFAAVLTQSPRAGQTPSHRAA